MIPRIARRGHSFKGAGLYYLHDKGALSSERVAWTQTLNLETHDPELALRCMAQTDMEARRARDTSHEAGRKRSAGNVFAYSLSWHGEQTPDREAMQAAALQTLSRLGLSEHETLIVAHDDTDTDHAHVHVIVNLTHPESRKVADLSFSQRKLSAWASEYERGEGKIYCTERERNAERREQGEITKYQDEKLKDAPDFSALYHACDSGTAFVAGLEEAGYVLARGDKGRLVIVDGAGVIQNLVRQIEGARKKDIEAKLSDIDLAALPEANGIAQQRREARPEREEPPAPQVQAEEREALHKEKAPQVEAMPHEEREATPNPQAQPRNHEPAAPDPVTPKATDRTYESHVGTVGSLPRPPAITSTHVAAVGILKPEAPPPPPASRQAGSVANNPVQESPVTARKNPRQAARAAPEAQRPEEMLSGMIAAISALIGLIGSTLHRIRHDIIPDYHAPQAQQQTAQPNPYGRPQSEQEQLIRRWLSRSHTTVTVQQRRSRARRKAQSMRELFGYEFEGQREQAQKQSHGIPDTRVTEASHERHHAHDRDDDWER